MPNESFSPSFSPRRRWQVALSVGTSVLALLAILMMANYLAARHSHRFYWSADKRFQLSPVTKELLRSITNQVQVVVFYDRTKPLYDLVSDLLSQYQVHSPRLQVEYVDYERSLGRAQIVQAEYGLAPAAEGDRIVFSAGGKRKVVYAKDLSEYDYNALFRGEEVKLTGFKGEQLFTSALFSLIEARPVKACFLQGHGEHDPSDKDDHVGYSSFARILEESQITIAKLDPAALLDEDVPGDCQLLIVANPLTTLMPEELERVDRYLNLGGRMLILFGVGSLKEGTGLEKLLASWGVEVGRNVVYEASQGKAGDIGPILVTQFGAHPIVNPLARTRLLLISPRSIGPRANTPQSADAPKVVELATTGTDGTAIQLNGRVERSGAPIPIMAAVEKGAVQGITADRGAARIVAVGDSQFLANTAIRMEANRDFARNAVNWLLNREILMQGIATKSIKEYRISMTNAELATVQWLFLAGFPGGVLFVGFLVWLRRRA